MVTWQDIFLCLITFLPSFRKHSERWSRSAYPVLPYYRYPLSCLLKSIKNYSGVADGLRVISGTTLRTTWKSSTLGSNSQWALRRIFHTPAGPVLQQLFIYSFVSYLLSENLWSGRDWAVSPIHLGSELSSRCRSPRLLTLQINIS